MSQSSPKGCIMTLRRFALPMSTTVRTVTGLALLAVLGVGIASTNTDAVVAGRFTAALEAAPRETTVDVAANTDKALISGSEAYWLEKRRHDSAGATIEPAAWSTAPFLGAVAVGSRITVSTGKDAHEFEVVSIADVPPGPGTATPANGRAERKITITCRDLNAADGQLQTFETIVGTVPGSSKPARAL